MPYIKFIVLVAVICLVIAPRVFDVGKFQTADEKRWLANTVAFISNLAHGDLGHLMIQPHPGVTTQWLAAPTIWYRSWGMKKISLVWAQIILIGVIGYFSALLLGKRFGVITIALLAINPALVGHTRILAMDSLLAHFTMISLLALLVWHKTKSERYVLTAGLTAAAAYLSKIPGVLLIPFSLGMIVLWWIKQGNVGKISISQYKKATLIWLAGLAIGTVLILPSVLFEPRLIIDDVFNWFKSDDYYLHQIGWNYYLTRSLVFFTTPLQMTAIVALVILLIKKRLPDIERETVVVIGLFAVLFLIAMSMGGKKGDRYILPVFVTFDFLAAAVLHRAFSFNLKRLSVKVLVFSLIALFALQSLDLYMIHPYAIAYVNPITSVVFEQRRLGWGEGLDLAAEYLNSKKDARNLKVASYFPVEFGDNFIGETVPLHKFDQESVDYVVVYRAIFERGDDAWESDVINRFRNKEAEKIVAIGNINMVWIFRKDH